MIKSAATFLYTKSYCSMDIEELLKAASVLVESFELLLKANGFNPDPLSTEIYLLYTHVVQFLRNCFPVKYWQRLFKLKDILQLKTFYISQKYPQLYHYQMPKPNVFILFCGECILKSEHGSTTQHWKIFLELEVIAISQTKNMKKPQSYLQQRNKMVQRENVQGSQRDTNIYQTERQ